MVPALPDNGCRADTEVKESTWTHPAIYRAAYLAPFSYECLAPSLQIYDKVYENMGVGDGIFSWCTRARRQGGK